IRDKLVTGVQTCALPILDQFSAWDRDYVLRLDLDVLLRVARLHDGLDADFGNTELPGAVGHGGSKGNGTKFFAARDLDGVPCFVFQASGFGDDLEKGLVTPELDHTGV